MTRRPHQERMDMAVRLACEGMSAQEAAEAMDVAPSGVTARLRVLGHARGQGWRDRQHGRRILSHGEAHYAARLTAAQVREARRLRASGWSYPEIIARLRLPVSCQSLRRACTGHTWKHLAEEN